MLPSIASVQRLLLGSGVVAQGSNLDDRGLDNPPASQHGSSDESTELRLASEWTRVEGTWVRTAPARRKPGLYPSPDYSANGHLP